MNNLILIKYGELTTKKANRNTFTKLLANNVKSILKGENINIRFDRVRMYIECDNAEEIVKKLQKVFGIHSIVICHKVNTNTEDTMAPINAPACTVTAPMIGRLPTKIAAVAPAEAPDEIPSRYGSAIEFLVMACIRIPTRLRPAPTQLATNTFGSLIPQTMPSA